MPESIGGLSKTIITLIVTVLVLVALAAPFYSAVGTINTASWGGGKALGDASIILLELAYPAFILGLAVGAIYLAFKKVTGKD
jgi:hypothetical protein